MCNTWRLFGLFINNKSTTETITKISTSVWCLWNNERLSCWNSNSSFSFLANAFRYANMDIRNNGGISCSVSLCFPASQVVRTVQLKNNNHFNFSIFEWDYFASTRMRLFERKNINNSANTVPSQYFCPKFSF